MKYNYTEFLALLSKIDDKNKLDVVNRNISDVREYIKTEGVVETLVAIAKQCKVKSHAYQITLLFLNQVNTPQEARQIGRALGKWAKPLQQEFRKACKDKNNNDRTKSLPHFLRYLKSLPKDARLKALTLHLMEIGFFMRSAEDPIETLVQILRQLTGAKERFDITRHFAHWLTAPAHIKKVANILGDLQNEFYEYMEQLWDVNPIHYEKYEDFLDTFSHICDSHVWSMLNNHQEDLSRFIDEHGLMQVFNDLFNASLAKTEWTKSQIATGITHKITSLEQMNELGSQLSPEHTSHFYQMADMSSKFQRTPEAKLSRSRSSIFATEASGAAEEPIDQPTPKHQRRK